ncbi:hypothetical protein KCV03_g9976, partial [Aureobasidium melanogenum]
MSAQDSVDTEEQAAFFVPPLHQLPSIQYNNTDIDASGDTFVSDDQESNENTDTADDSDNDDDDNDDASDDDFDDGKDEELFPEKPWARRCIETLRNSQEYYDLSRRWRLIQSSVEAGIEMKGLLDDFEAKEISPFVNRKLLFFTELVIQAYIKDALTIVGVGHKNPSLRPPGASRLPRAVLEGRRGLCWQTDSKAGTKRAWSSTSAPSIRYCLRMKPTGLSSESLTK